MPPLDPRMNVYKFLMKGMLLNTQNPEVSSVFLVSFYEVHL